MLETQPLRRVVQLDVHAEVVGVHLELVARDQPAVLGDVQPEVGDPVSALPSRSNFQCR